MVARAVFIILSLVTVHPGPCRCRPGAGVHRRHRARLQRTETPVDDDAGARPFPRGRAAGLSRRGAWGFSIATASSSFLKHGAGHLERRDDQHPACLRRPRRARARPAGGDPRWIGSVALAAATPQFVVQLPAVLGVFGHAACPGGPLLTLAPGVRLGQCESPAPAFVSRGVVPGRRRTSTRCSRACCRPAPSTALMNAPVLLHPAGQPLSASAVCAAELPAVSGVAGDEAARAQALRTRLGPALQRIAFFVVPSSQPCSPGLR